jgi:putative transposase
MRDEGTVRSKAVYLALAILPDGSRDILGIWIEQTEGAKFWLKVFTDLKTRSCQDILIAVTDGLKGMSEALAAVYPATTLQTCLVHLIRHSLDFATWKVRKDLAAASAPSTPRVMPTSPPRRSTSSRRGHGDSAIPPSWRAGAALGPTSSRFRVSARRAQGALHHQRA